MIRQNLTDKQIEISLGNIDRDITKILERCENQNRGLTPDEKRQVAKLEGQELEFRDVQSARLRDVKTPAQRTIIRDALRGNDPSRRESGFLGTGPEFRQLFGHHENEILDDGGFESIGDFFKACCGRQIDPRLIDVRSQSGLTGESGGFLVPTAYSAQLLDAALPGEIVRPNCKVLPMETDSAYFPIIDGDDHSSTTHGGFSSQWLGETSTATESNAKFTALQMISKKLMVYSVVSNELLSDSPDFARIFGQAMAENLGWSLDEACLIGDGANKPLGITNDPALIVVDKTAGQAADSLSYQNLVDVYSRLDPRYTNDKSLRWICNATLKPSLMTLYHSGSNSDMFYMPLSEKDGVFRIFGIKVAFTEHLPVLGEQGDLVLCALSQFGLGLRKQIIVDSTQALKFDSYQTSFRAVLRADGKGLHTSVVTPANGDSLSWCVTLQERA